MCPAAFDGVEPGSRYPSSTADGFMEDGVDACEAVILWSLRVLCRRVETLLELGLGFDRCWSLDRRVSLREAGPGRLIDCPKRGGTEWCKAKVPCRGRFLLCYETRMAQNRSGWARFSKDADDQIHVSDDGVEMRWSLRTLFQIVLATIRASLC